MLATLDTNILVYAADTTAGSKHDQAKSIVIRLAQRHGVLPQQVMGEFLNVVRRFPNMNARHTRRIASDLIGPFTILPTSPDNLFDAFDLATRHKLQFWDAVILTVCRVNGVGCLITEDMQDGAVVDGVLLLDPFDPANRSRLNALLAA